MPELHHALLSDAKDSEADTPDYMRTVEVQLESDLELDWTLCSALRR